MGVCLSQLQHVTSDARPFTGTTTPQAPHRSEIWSDTEDMPRRYRGHSRAGARSAALYERGDAEGAADTDQGQTVALLVRGDEPVSHLHEALPHPRTGHRVGRDVVGQQDRRPALPAWDLRRSQVGDRVFRAAGAERLAAEMQRTRSGRHASDGAWRPSNAALRRGRVITVPADRAGSAPDRADRCHRSGCDPGA